MEDIASCGAANYGHVSLPQGTWVEIRLVVDYEVSPVIIHHLQESFHSS